MQVLFVSDYDDETRDHYQTLGIELPRPDTVYTVRAVFRSAIDATRSFALHEIINPPMAYSHEIFGDVSREPTFNVDGFTDINGRPFFNRKIRMEFDDLLYRKSIYTHIN